MKKMIAIGFVMASLTAACGSKKPKTENATGGGSAVTAPTGGASYGSAAANPCGGAANPCAPK